MLGVDDPLPRRPSRVLVAGTSGAGKTTLASALAGDLGVTHFEVDALYHGPGWTPRPTFVEDVTAAVAAPTWVMEWEYRLVRDLLAERADLLLWLDLPRRTVMRQVVTRTLRRRLRREVLWNGNLEPPLRTFVTDDGHIVRWAWRTHAHTRVRVLELPSRHPGLVVVRLRSHAEVRRWRAGPLADVVGTSAAPGSGRP
ncbi:AAA family ATPase [Pseudokineococcus sp. 1T1Z-3]|uniref:AAA family ATPase n=1 Tax=Pseudokineococcus sp. 1T1Z-3 TaxID=3132745 RepID=UPI0030A14B5A